METVGHRNGFPDGPTNFGAWEDGEANEALDVPDGEQMDFNLDGDGNFETESDESEDSVEEKENKDKYDSQKHSKYWGFLISIDGHYKSLALGKAPKCGSNGRTCGWNKCKRCGESEGCEDLQPHQSLATGYILGAGEECDRKIRLPGVSQRHAVFYKTVNDTGDQAKETVMCEDLSTTGTFINGERLGQNVSAPLKNRDQITIVEGATFLFHSSVDWKGEKFSDKYHLGAPLGKGRFAEVYSATERQTGEEYAVKLIKIATSGQKVKERALQLEIALLMSVTHTNIVCLRATYREKDGVYSLLELARGGELFQLIVDRGKLSEDECRIVFSQLFDALSYLHSRQIVHRDIKPENILLASKSNLNIRLADFGLSKIIDEDSFTRTICGSPSYVAPEILKATKEKKYGTAVDVWSSGVCLYIALCGFPPFSEQLSPPSLEDQIQQGRYSFPSPYFDDISDDALDLICGMLVVDPLKRISIDTALKHSWFTGEKGN